MAQQDPSLVGEVLEELVRPRYRALYVLARQSLQPADAEDAVQSFLTRLFASAKDRGFVDRLDPARGSLRAYLKTAFRHHLTNLHEMRVSQKRGGGRKAVDVSEVEEQIAAHQDNPEQLFDRAWAASLFADVLGHLKEEFESGERRGPFQIVEQLLTFGAVEDYESLAARHAMSVPQLKAFVHRAKRRFRALLRDRVEQTLGEGQDVDEEIRRLLEDLVA